MILLFNILTLVIETCCPSACRSHHGFVNYAREEEGITGSEEGPLIRADHSKVLLIFLFRHSQFRGGCRKSELVRKEASHFLFRHFFALSKLAGSNCQLKILIRHFHAFWFG